MNSYHVDHFSGPIGGYGFRKGYWPVIRHSDGVALLVYCSVPHAAELDEQARIVVKAAEGIFDRYDAGERPDPDSWGSFRIAHPKGVE